jgi:glycine hydroxymethyltransferase
MGTGEMQKIAEWTDRVVSSPNDEALLAKIAGEVRELCSKFAAPGIRV